MAARPTRKRKRASKRKPKRNPGRKSTKHTRSKTIFRNVPWRYILLGVAVVFLIYTLYLDFVVRDQFEDKRWALPAHVYARPLELYVGLRLQPQELEGELNLLNYRYAYHPNEPGTFQRLGNEFQVVTRSFQYWDTQEVSRPIKIRFSDGVIAGLTSTSTNDDIDLVRLDPVLVGGIYPAHKEDRILVQLNDVPELLPKILIAIEDRKFREHFGIDILAIGRAVIANIKAGGTVQGGSTLTQQLVKNFFLSNERTLWRKFNEVIMAVLLDFHYDKNEILEAYLNEIYLGQDRHRAIHGFGLASRFYFDKPIKSLGLNEITTLVALIRGPSYYHPDRHPERLRERRDRILDQLVQQGVIEQSAASAVKARPLNIIKKRTTSVSTHPAFIELVRRQLREYYRESDLTSEGLKIFTTMSPLLQKEIEQTVEQRVNQLDKQRQLHGQLQSAAIITNVTSGEVLAMVGDRNPRFDGFNRALDAARPIGSLMKPVIYLSALKRKQQYNWLTSILDDEISLKAKDGNIWSPKNYDGESHGDVPLIAAMTQSYNQATVRLGLEVGFPAINDTLLRLGIKRDIPPYPAILLGATEMTPFEVAQLYQTIAANGFRSPVRAIREVLDSKGQPLRRYPIQVEQAFDSNLVQTLNSGLAQVIEQGTARSVRSRLPGDMLFGGKTGTTNDTRDSWFAGFSASHLGVVWLGTDDNLPTGLSGSSGALSLWGDIFVRLSTNGLSFDASEELEFHWVDPVARKLSEQGCDGAMILAFLPGTAPTEKVECASGARGKIDKTINWFKSLFR